VTARRTLVVRDRGGERLSDCQLYTSYIGCSPDDSYLTAAHFDGAVTYHTGPSAIAAEDAARAALLQCGEIVGESRFVQRSTLRAIRVGGAIRIVHGASCVPLDQAMARTAASMLTAELPTFLESSLPTLGDYANVAKLWLSDTTIDWNQLSQDLVQITGAP
jgi:hypothetical protein